MSRTVTRLFDSHTAAISAVEHLEQAGVDHDRISLVANNADNWHAGHKHAGGTVGSTEGPLGDRNHDGENDVADGAGKGAATGGLLGALKEAGHTDDEAHVYSEGVRRGGALVSVRCEDGDGDRIEQILNGRSGVDASSRGQAYRQAGWDRFDPQAKPYSADEVMRERTLYGEDRSFGSAEGARDDTGAANTDQRKDPGAVPPTPRAF